MWSCLVAQRSCTNAQRSLRACPVGIPLRIVYRTNAVRSQILRPSTVRVARKLLQHARALRRQKPARAGEAVLARQHRVERRGWIATGACAEDVGGVLDIEGG